MYKNKYNEALKKAKEYHKRLLAESYNDYYAEELEHIFPELTESEDEKIRKEIINVFKSLGELKIPADINFADIFTWLEKQRPEVNVVKFKPGDKVTNGISTYTIDSIEDNYYRTKDGKNIPLNLEYRWKIVENEQKPAELHKEDEQNLNVCLSYIPDEFLRKWLTDIIHVKYDKSVWCEEDRDYYNAIITKLEVTQDDAALTNNQMKFLKSLKNRIVPQSHQEWNEKDKETLDSILNDIEQNVIPDENDVQWLKSLKERIGG